MTVALAIAGSQFAHASAYRLVTPDQSERSQQLASTGHAYMAYASLALAVGTMLVLGALAVELGHVARRRHGIGVRPSAVMFAMLVPGIFVCQEHFERWFHDGVFPWNAVLEPTFVVGVLLQLPFALAAYLLARLLLHAVRTLGRLLGGPARPRAVATASLSTVAGVMVPRVAVVALGYGSRGPPGLCS